MTIRYEPNAAALSWLALCQNLDSRAQMEKSIFTMLNNNTSMSLTLTQNQATSAKAAFDAQADQTLTEGMMGMIGAGVSTVVTLGSMGMQAYNENQASNVANTTTTKIGVEEVNNPIPEEKDDVELQSMNGEENDTEEKAVVDGQNPGKKADTTQTEANKKEELSEEQKNTKQRYENNAMWWAQNGRTFSELSNQFIGDGLAKLLTVDDIKAQGVAKANEATAQGLGQVFSSQNSVFTSALQSCDTNMQNTNSTIATIIGVSARG